MSVCLQFKNIYMVNILSFRFLVVFKIVRYILSINNQHTHIDDILLLFCPHLLDVHFWDKTDKASIHSKCQRPKTTTSSTMMTMPAERQLNVNGFNWNIYALYICLYKTQYMYNWKLENFAKFASFEGVCVWNK